MSHLPAALFFLASFPSCRAHVEDVFDVVVEVNQLDSHDKAHLQLLRRPNLGVTFTKLHAWTLVQVRATCCTAPAG